MTMEPSNTNANEMVLMKKISRTVWEVMQLAVSTIPEDAESIEHYNVPTKFVDKLNRCCNSVIKQFKGSDPLDGDDTELIANYIKQKLDLHYGNW